MKRLKQQFATYKISSAIREIGFDEECIAWYNSSSEDSLSMCDVFGLLVDKCSEDFIKNSDGKYVAAPTWSQLIDWFREKYSILITEGYDIFPRRRWVVKCNYYKFLYDEYHGFYESREQAILKTIEILKKQKSDEKNN